VPDNRSVDSAAVRRAAAILAFALLAVGCGSGEEAAPLPETVVGTVEQATAEGDPQAGRRVYDASGCGGCHAFTPASSTADVGPDLDELPELAENADQGRLAEFVRTSLTNPNAYVEEGYEEGVMPPFEGSEKELADLVAFLTQQQEG
jgi:mono/diheme cytochrome c family protein